MREWRRLARRFPPSDFAGYAGDVGDESTQPWREYSRRLMFNDVELRVYVEPGVAVACGEE